MIYVRYRWCRHLLLISIHFFVHFGVDGKLTESYFYKKSKSMIGIPELSFLLLLAIFITLLFRKKPLVIIRRHPDPGPLPFILTALALIVISTKRITDDATDQSRDADVGQKAIPGQQHNSSDQNAGLMDSQNF